MLPPLAVSVVDCPVQSDAGEAVAVTAGNGFTVTVTLTVVEHVELNPVTE